MMVPHQAHRLGDVAVVADHHRAIVGIEPAVIEQVDGGVDIGVPFLGPDDLLISVNFRYRAVVPAPTIGAHTD